MSELFVKNGICHAYYAFDVGLLINLDTVDRRISAAVKERASIRHKRKMSKYFDFTPVPIRIAQDHETITIGKFKTQAVVEVLVFDFGAISVCFKIPLEGSFEDLISLSEALYENHLLKEGAHSIVRNLTKTISAAITKFNISERIEDYFVFQVKEFHREVTVSELMNESRLSIASILRSESLSLSDQEVNDVIHHRISYGTNDVSFINWGGAFIYEREADDVCSVLEYANVALLEFSYLDHELELALDQFYEFVAKSRQGRYHGALRTMLHKIGQFQLDSAILFEGVTNGLKLLGDEYLARVYHLAGRKFAFAEWDANINRKLRTIESIYEKISDAETSRKMEILELIIIILIAISILIPFFQGAAH